MQIGSNPTPDLKYTQPGPHEFDYVGEPTIVRSSKVRSRIRQREVLRIICAERDFFLIDR